MKNTILTADSDFSKKAPNETLFVFQLFKWSGSKMGSWVVNLLQTWILVIFQGQGRIRRGVYNLAAFDLPLWFSSPSLIFFPATRRVTLGCFISIFFSTDSVACLSEYVTGDKIHWCGGNFGIAFAVLVHGQKIGSSQHSRKKYFSKIPKKVSL